MTPTSRTPEAGSPVSAPANDPAISNLDGVVPGSADPQTLPHTCGGCDARWSGYRTAHCGSGCHLTFTGVSTFDMHRNGGRCLRPHAMGMVEVPGRAYQVWGFMADPE